jgi:phosphatidylglycerophosphate synthase
VDIQLVAWDYLVEYWRLFFTDVEFQESQPWMQPVLEFCAIFKPNEWTALRLIIILIVVGFMWLTGDIYLQYITFLLWVIIISGATDFCDGKSARYWNMCTKFGAQFDAAVDKVYIFCSVSRPWALLVVTLDHYWMPRFIFITLLMLATELGKVFMRNSKRFSDDCYTANMFGKYKFLFQTIAVLLMWRLAFYYPQWELGPMLICLAWLIATDLSILSIIAALYPEYKECMVEFSILLFMLLAVILDINAQLASVASLISLTSVYRKIKVF